MPELRLPDRLRRWRPFSAALRRSLGAAVRRPLSTARVVVGAGVLGLVVALLAVTFAGPFDSSGRRVAEADRATAADSVAPGSARPGPGGQDSAGRTSAGLPAPAPSAAAVLGTLTAAAAPRAGSLAGRMGPLLAKPALGDAPTASVVDVASGTELYGARAGTAATPASVTKLATAVATLDSLGAEHRIDTRVVRDGENGLVLVGGGDPTLTARAHANGFASLRDLAVRTAKALKKAEGTTDGEKGEGDDKRQTHQGAYTLTYDTSLFTGPQLHPIGPNENISPVTPLMADEGRLDTSSSGPAPRSAEPARDAAARFRDLLSEQGVRLSDGVREHDGKSTDKDTKPLAVVSSAPLATIVERMLTYSDNDIAENLARQTALAAGEAASFDGAGKAVRARLDKLGLPLDGARFADGSGLDRADRLTPRLLTALLAEAGDKQRPGLRSVLTGLPVAGFTGTLATRYTAHTNAAGTGVVRAKTGTLTGVNTLAGTVVTTSGRLLAFAFMTHEAPNPLEAQAAMDRMAAALAGT